MHAMEHYVGVPKLQDNLLIKVEENTKNVVIDLLQGPGVFPEPTIFVWNKDRLILHNQLQTSLMLTYSSVTFASVRRDDRGKYTVFGLRDLFKPLENYTGNFFLDVICNEKLLIS